MAQRTLYDGSDAPLVIEQAESFDLVFMALTVDVSAGNVRTETVIAASNLLTLTLTLYDAASGSVINSRSAQDVLGVNGGTVEASAVRIRLQPLDNPIVSATLAVGGVEWHVARLTYTWNDGVTTRTGIEEVRFGVRRVA